MATANNQGSIIVAAIADGAIAEGHCVNLVSSVSGVAHVAQSSGATTAWGIYVGQQAAAQYEHVEVCIFGPCKAWLDGAITVNPPQNVANDADGHVIADTTNLHRCIGYAMDSNGATENFGMVFVNLHDNSLA